MNYFLIVFSHISPPKRKHVHHYNSNMFVYTTD